MVICHQPFKAFSDPKMAAAMQENETWESEEFCDKQTVCVNMEMVQINTTKIYQDPGLAVLDIQNLNPHRPVHRTYDWVQYASRTRESVWLDMLVALFLEFLIQAFQVKTMQVTSANIAEFTNVAEFTKKSKFKLLPTLETWITRVYRTSWATPGTLQSTRMTRMWWTWSTRPCINRAINPRCLLGSGHGCFFQGWHAWWYGWNAWRYAWRR